MYYRTQCYYVHTRVSPIANDNSNNNMYNNITSVRARVRVIFLLIFFFFLHVFTHVERAILACAQTETQSLEITRERAHTHKQMCINAVCMTCTRTVSKRRAMARTYPPRD